MVLHGMLYEIVCYCVILHDIARAPCGCKNTSNDRNADELEVKKVVEASHLLNWFIQPHLDERQAACLTSKITLT